MSMCLYSVYVGQLGGRNALHCHPVYCDMVHPEEWKKIYPLSLKQAPWLLISIARNKGRNDSPHLTTVNIKWVGGQEVSLQHWVYRRSSVDVHSFYVFPLPQEHNIFCKPRLPALYIAYSMCHKVPGKPKLTNSLTITSLKHVYS